MCLGYITKMGKADLSKQVFRKKQILEEQIPFPQRGPHSLRQTSLGFVSIIIREKMSQEITTGPS